MNASTTLLAITSVVLGVSTAYLARELGIERERAQAKVSTLAAWRTRIESPERRVAGIDADRSSPAPRPQTSSPAPQPPESESPAKCPPKPPREQVWAKEREQWEKEIADPATRALHELEQRVEIRWENPGLAAALGLAPELEEKLIDLLARQMLEARGFSYEQMAPASGADTSRHAAQLLALLGAEKLERYRKYQMTAPEHQQIRALRARLDERNALSEDQASRLVEAMSGERIRYLQELNELFRGTDVGYSLSYPLAVLPGRRHASERLAFAESQVERTEQFMKRIRDVAAGVLTPQQLRRYEQVQEAQRNQIQQNLRHLRTQAANKQDGQQ